MTVNSLAPAFVQFFYHSPFSQHVQTVPTKAYSPSSGEFTNWNGVGVDATDMITALMVQMTHFYPAGVLYDNARVFTQADANASPVLRMLVTFLADNEGDFATPGESQAVEGTFSYLGDGGSKGRLVFLDCASGNNFAPQFTTGPSGILFDLLGIVSDLDNAWATRAGERPATFLQYSKTLNEKLRREYRMF